MSTSTGVVIDGVIQIAMKILLEIVQFLPGLRKTEEKTRGDGEQGFPRLLSCVSESGGDCKACYDPYLYSINNNLARRCGFLLLGQLTALW